MDSVEVDNIIYGNLSPSEIFCNSTFNLIAHLAAETDEDATRPIADIKDEDTYNPGSNFCLGKLQCFSVLPDTPLANTDFSDIFNVKIDSKEYSDKLNKIYTKMNDKFSVEFTLNTNITEPLFIRGTLQYAEEHKTTDTVVRCIMHEQKNDSTNKDVEDHVRFHVLRCFNTNAVYLGNKANKEHLSVLMPLSEPQAGVKGVKELFYFVCMSSCGTPGIARRNLEVIFHLENRKGKVLGRRCIKARICACPRRDREKEEKEAPVVPSKGKKRKINSQLSIPEKVAYLADHDLKIYSLQLDIVGKDNVINTLSDLEKSTGYKLLQHMGQPAETMLREKLNQIIIMKNRYIEDRK